MARLSRGAWYLTALAPASRGDTLPPVASVGATMREMESLIAAPLETHDCVWRNLPLLVRLASVAAAGLACLNLAYGVLVAPLGEQQQMLCVAAFATAAVLQLGSFFYACWRARD